MFASKGVSITSRIGHPSLPGAFLCRVSFFGNLGGDVSASGGGQVLGCTQALHASSSMRALGGRAGAPLPPLSVAPGRGEALTGDRADEWPPRPQRSATTGALAMPPMLGRWLDEHGD